MAPNLNLPPNLTVVLTLGFQPTLSILTSPNLVILQTSQPTLSYSS